MSGGVSRVLTTEAKQLGGGGCSTGGAATKAKYPHPIPPFPGSLLFLELPLEELIRCSPQSSG